MYEDMRVYLQEKFNEMEGIAVREDIAARLGRLLFGDEEEFEKYFLDAFWRAGYYGE